MTEAFSYQEALLKFAGPIRLPSGAELPALEVRIGHYGAADGRKPVALFFHALSGDARVHEWWPKFNFAQVLADYQVVVVNSLGSCVGTTGPDSMVSFPEITIGDQAFVVRMALDRLGFGDVALAVGASLGGMQLLELLAQDPGLVRRAIVIAASPPSLKARIQMRLCCAVLDGYVDSFGGEGSLAAENRLALARLIFRQACATEKGLEILNSKLGQSPESDPLWSYFGDDGIQYSRKFSARALRALLRSVAEFKFPDFIQVDRGLDRPGVVLVAIQDDPYTPESEMQRVGDKLEGAGFCVRKKRFVSALGHEAWLLEGERLYEFIREDMDADPAAAPGWGSPTERGAGELGSQASLRLQ